MTEARSVMPRVTKETLTRRRYSGRSSLTLVAPIVMVGAFLALLGSYSYPRLIFLAIACMAVLVVTFPMLQPWYQPMSGWTLLAVYVWLGVGVRGLYLAVGYPDRATLDTLFLLGRRPAYFIRGGLVLLAVLAVLAFGYSMASRGPIRTRSTPRGLLPSINRVYLVVAVMSAISLAAFVVFVQQTGGWDWSNFSTKRVRLGFGDRADAPQFTEFRSYGYIQYLARLGQVAFLYLLGYCLIRYRQLRLGHVVALAVLFLNCALLPVYASQRSLLLAPIVMTLAVISLIRGRIRARSILLGGIVCLALFQALTTWRSNEAEALPSVEDVLLPLDSVDSLILNRSLIDVPKTAHVIGAVPARLPWQYGKTMIGPVVAPIPRSIWESKPLVHPGPIIGDEIYGTRATGVPPGLPAELYWNFGLVGSLVASAVIGYLLGATDRRLRPGRQAADLAGVLIYVVIVIRLGATAVGSSVSQAVTGALIDGSQVLFLLFLIGRRRNVAHREPVAVKP